MRHKLIPSCVRNRSQRVVVHMTCGHRAQQRDSVRVCQASTCLLPNAAMMCARRSGSDGPNGPESATRVAVIEVAEEKVMARLFTGRLMCLHVLQTISHGSSITLVIQRPPNATSDLLTWTCIKAEGLLQLQRMCCVHRNAAFGSAGPTGRGQRRHCCRTRRSKA